MRGPRDTLSVTDTSSRIGVQEREQAQLFVVLDRGRPLSGGSRHSLANIDHVTLGRGEARAAHRVVEDGRPTLRLEVPDGRMSGLHARLALRAGSWTLSDSQSTNGVRLNGHRVDQASLSDGDWVELGRTLFRFRKAVATPINAPGDVDSAELGGLLACFGTICPGPTRDVENLERVARSNLSLLLEGETGTGKEVLARAIHTASGRSGAFVAVNCGALPQGLVESLLFGHKKGAFSGAARDEPGLVRAAEGGTLFFDEVGDLPASSQVALLRVLQEHEVMPVGATRPETVDVRFVSATHRSLAAMTAAGAFRQDLLARLAQFTHALPPLRDRIEDVGVLLAAILARVAGARAASLSLSADAARHLVGSKWSANVRELEHQIRVSLLLAEGSRLELVAANPSDANLPPRPEPAAIPRSRFTNVPRELSPEDAALYQELLAKVREHHGNLTQVAQAMGKARRQIQRWTLRFGIDVTQFRD